MLMLLMEETNHTTEQEQQTQQWHCLLVKMEGFSFLPHLTIQTPKEPSKASTFTNDPLSSNEIFHQLLSFARMNENLHPLEFFFLVRSCVPCQRRCWGRRYSGDGASGTAPATRCKARDIGKDPAVWRGLGRWDLRDAQTLLLFTN